MGYTNVIDERQTFQSIDGFGFALTGGSAELLGKMDADARSGILHELFGTDDKNIGVSYIRLSIGASDLNSFVYSYDGLEEGKTDFDLAKFSLAQDLNDVVPVMKEILAINPDIKILGSPWSAPTWMKTNNNIRGGKLKEECYDVYAHYFVKYVQEMAKQGITIDGNFVERNLAYYTIAHASKFIRPGSVRIASTNRGDRTVQLHEDEQHPGVNRVAVTENTQVLPNVAFKTPGGKVVLVVVNDTWNEGGFKIQYKGEFANLRLAPGSVGTYVWNE